MSDRPVMELSERALRRLIRETVHETLIGMGIDATNPIELQQDFQHLRDWRRSTQAVKRKGLLTVVGMAVAGLAALVWLALTSRT